MNWDEQTGEYSYEINEIETKINPKYYSKLKYPKQEALVKRMFEYEIIETVSMKIWSEGDLFGYVERIYLDEPSHELQRVKLVIREVLEEIMGVVESVIYHLLEPRQMSKRRYGLTE